MRAPTYLQEIASYARVRSPHRPEGGSCVRRIARFEGGDPSRVDETIARVRSMMEEGQTPPGLERRSMMLVDRQTGVGMGLTFFDNEESMRRGDQALNEMTPPADMTGTRSSVEMYEVAIDRAWD